MFCRDLDQCEEFQSQSHCSFAWILLYSLGQSICACVHYTFLNDKMFNCYLQLHETRYLGAVSICDLANCKCHFNASNTGKLFNVETIQCRYKRKFPCCSNNNLNCNTPATKLRGILQSPCLSVCLSVC